jgi:hypothetical protein
MNEQGKNDNKRSATTPQNEPLFDKVNINKFFSFLFGQVCGEQTKFHYVRFSIADAHFFSQISSDQ